jgi:hypothetical protein
MKIENLLDVLCSFMGHEKKYMYLASLTFRAVLTMIQIYTFYELSMNQFIQRRYLHRINPIKLYDDNCTICNVNQP